MSNKQDKLFENLKKICKVIINNKNIEKQEEYSVDKWIEELYKKNPSDVEYDINENDQKEFGDPINFNLIETIKK